MSYGIQNTFAWSKRSPCFPVRFVFARLLLRRLKEGMAETHGACGRCVGKRVSSSPGFKGWRKNFEKLGFKDLERERFKSKLDVVM